MTIELTLEEKACNFETQKHRDHVRHFINTVIIDLMKRAEVHDNSKMEPPEVAMFTEQTPKLAALKFGTPEYTASLEALGPALAHHYANNRHHPEHHARGIEDMNLIDLIEWFCDCKAASLRQNDGNIRKSIKHNVKRYKICKQLASILENTIEAIEAR